MSKQQVTVLVLVAVAAVVGYVMLLLLPSQNELEDVRDDIAREEERNQQLRDEIAVLRDLADREDEMDGALDTARRMLPTVVDQDGLLEQLDAAADDAGVRVTNFTSAQPTARADDDEDGADAAEIHLTMTVEGGWDELGGFLAHVNDPQTVSRGVVVEQVSFAADGEGTVTASVSATTFSQLDPADGDVAPVAETLRQTVEEP